MGDNYIILNSDGLKTLTIAIVAASLGTYISVKTVMDTRKEEKRKVKALKKELRSYRDRYGTL